MRKHISVILALVLALSSIGHSADDNTKAMVYDYELDSTSLIYCSMYRDSQASTRDFWGDGLLTTQPITTSGSTTALTAVDSGHGPFTGLAAGDEITVNLDGKVEKRYLSAVASAIAATSNADINLGDGKRGTLGYGFFARYLTCGTAATDGWIDVPGKCVTVIVDVDQMNATSIDAQFEGRHLGAVSPVVVINTKNFTAAGSIAFNSCNYTVSGVITSWPIFDQVRLGLKVNTDDGNDLTTNAEKITVTASSSVR